MSYLGPDESLSSNFAKEFEALKTEMRAARRRESRKAYSPDLVEHDTVARRKPVDPICVSCPRCGAGKGEKCRMLVSNIDGVQYFFMDRHVVFHSERRNVRVDDPPVNICVCAMLAKERGYFRLNPTCQQYGCRAVYG